MERQRCERCGACVEECAPQALTFTSRAWALDSLLREALKDKAYHHAFGGGVTVSGGEPLSQHPFVAEFLRRLQQAGVHTALDTCGWAPASALAAVLPYTDHVLFDIKFVDSALHRTHTGQGSEVILANLAVTADFIRQANRTQAPDKPGGMRLWIRTPLIPGATATPENIRAIGRLIRDHLGEVCERWELCAFNPACGSKHEKLGLAWAYAGYPLMSEADIGTLAQAARATGAVPGRLVTSGLVARTGTHKQECMRAHGHEQE
jgi:pyruvate formate lyase activating enzyme